MKPNKYRLLPAGAGIAILIIFALAFASCKNKRFHSVRKLTINKQLFSADDFSEALATALRSTDTATPKSKGLGDFRSAMRSVYDSNEYTPLWVAEEGITEAATLLIKDLDSLRGDGIDPERYGLKELSASLKTLEKSGDLKAAIAFDTSCTKAWLQASRDLLIGMILPRRADSLWHHSNDSTWNGPHDLLVTLDSGGTYPPLQQYRSRISTYGMLRSEYGRYRALSADQSLKALKSSLGTARKVPDSLVLGIVTKEFPWIQPADGDSMNVTAQSIRGVQERYGLAPTGKVDSSTLARLRMMPEEVMQMIAANMERLRWMPQSLESQYVIVNVPQMEMFFRKDGQDAFGMKVVVGQPARQTPALNAPMANVVFSPSWGVPPTILKKDVLPGISKRGSAYLTRKGLQAYDRRGRKVSPAMVTSDNYRQFSFRQPPGEDNALGDVKFNLPNRWDIYLHDTPHRSDFEKRYRAKSSGCVRVERPREFAEFILRDIEGRDKFDQWTIDSLIQLRRTRFENLKTKIPVHIVYLTAFENESRTNVRLLPDIYKRDGRLIAALDNLGEISAQ